MSTTRRDFMAAAVTAAGMTATHDLAHAEGHDHQTVPSDRALRTKSLESLLVEKGLVTHSGQHRPVVVSQRPPVHNL